MQELQISVGGTGRASLLGEPKYVFKLEMKSEELVSVHGEISLGSAENFSRGPFLCSFMHSLHRHFNYEKKAKQGNKVPMR